MIFRDFVEQTKDAVYAVAGGLAGGRPVSPMLHLESEAGVQIIAVDPRFFTEPGGRRRLIHGFAIPLVIEHEARKVAWTFTGAWSEFLPGDARDDGGDGQEVIVATFLDRERHELWTAPIHRPPAGVPFLGDWQYAGPDDSDGPLIRPIQEALR